MLAILVRTVGWIWERPYLLLTFTALFWAGNSIVGRGARDMIPPVALAFWRWSLALLLLLPLAWPHLRHDMARLKKAWKSVLMLGMLGIGAFNTLLYTGLQTTTAVNGLLLQSMQPGLILLLGVILFGDRARLLQLIGIVLSIIGALMIILQGDPAALTGLKLNGGDLVISAAVIIWSLYTVLLRKRPKVHPMSFLAATVTIGVAALFPLYISELASGRLIVNQAESWLAIAYVGLFPSLIAYLCFNRGVELLGPSTTGLYLNIMPVIGALLAVIFLNEAIRWFHFLGILLIGAGIICAVRPTQPQSPRP